MAAPDSPKKRNSSGTQRRHNKPLIEKRRRDRINDCLSQLQSLVLKARATESPRPGKLEKADILEMTVDYIKKNRNSNDDSTKGSGGDGDIQHHYVAGYEKCVKEVLQFLEQHKQIGSDVKEKISLHCQDKLKAQTVLSEPAEGIKCEQSDDEMDHSATPSPEIQPSNSPADVVKQEERTPVQNTAYVMPVPQNQSSPEPSPVKQATVQPISGPIKLVCGGDVLILLDSQSSNASSLSNIQFSKPPTIQRVPEIFPSCNVAMVTGNPTPTIPFPVYRLSNIPVASFPVTGSFLSTSQTLHVADNIPANNDTTKSHVISDHAPSLVDNLQRNQQEAGASMWRPW